MQGAMIKIVQHVTVVNNVSSCNIMVL